MTINKNSPHRLMINGQTYETLVAPQDTLLGVIRYHLDLIGTKQGCDKGDCGACTVLVDGEPHLSCLSLAQRFDESQAITTIEGLAPLGQPNLLVRAFTITGALQCGFCQPGMILSAESLLRENPSPSLAEIKAALSGNLCRCTGYTKIYLAVLCASLVLTNKANDLEEALVVARSQQGYLGEA